MLMYVLMLSANCQNLENRHTQKKNAWNPLKNFFSFSFVLFCKTGFYLPGSVALCRTKLNQPKRFFFLENKFRHSKQGSYYGKCRYCRLQLACGIYGMHDTQMEMIGCARRNGQSHVRTSMLPLINDVANSLCNKASMTFEIIFIYLMCLQSRISFLKRVMHVWHERLLATHFWNPHNWDGVEWYERGTQKRFFFHQLFKFQIINEKVFFFLFKNVHRLQLLYLCQNGGHSKRWNK